MAKKDAAAKAPAKEAVASKAPPAKAPAKEAAKAKDPPKKKAKAGAAAEEPSLLSKFRPKPRCVFFVAFLLLCGSIVSLYDPCDVKGKKRDCGHSGISPGACRTSACFLKGGGSIGKKTIKVKRKGGSSLGLQVAKNKEAFLIETVNEGAVKKHNEGLPADSEDIIRPGDQVLQVDKVSGSKVMSAIGKTTGGTVELELRRNRVPSFLMWLENQDGKPNYAEKMLTSPGGRHFAQIWRFLAQIALPCWYISGYPAASLPTYMTISAAVSFYMSRCCHDEKVPAGQPHCYKSKREPIPEVLAEARERIQTVMGKVAANPRSYFDWLFMP